jgi:hypothetical protein
MLEPAASAVVLLPYVRAWRTVADPLPEAAQLLVAPPQRVARPVRAYATAVRELASAVVRSGRLQTPPARLTGPDAPSPSEPPGTRWFGEGPRPARAPGGDRPAQAPRVVGAFRPVVASAPRHAVPQRGVRIVAPARAAADLAADAADPARRVDQAG